MKIILTNDDGIDAPGLAALERACESLGELVVVAPEREQSGVGHSITLWEPIRVREVGERRWRVNGTPADCARIAVGRFAQDATWLVSGINRGANLGIDVYTSGTVAAAREAAYHGLSSLAISQYIAPGRQIDWELTAARAARILARVMDEPLERGSFLNLNLPHPEHRDEEIAFTRCPVDGNPIAFEVDHDGDHVRYGGDYHARVFDEDSDVAVCFGGRIALSVLGRGHA